MSDGDFWLGAFIGILVLTALASFLLGRRPEWIGCLSVPFAVSVAMTIYVIIFEPDPQSPVFLGMFYFLAAVAGALGSMVGRDLHRRSR